VLPQQAHGGKFANFIVQARIILLLPIMLITNGEE